MNSKSRNDKKKRSVGKESKTKEGTGEREGKQKKIA